MIKEVILLSMLGTALCYPAYQQEIPNGSQVNDCSGNNWPGVGHQHSQGAGPLNPFGVDFQAAGHVWTVELCQKDSDGDGLTNGQELGDPNCQWSKDNQTALQAPTGHPGLACTSSGTGTVHGHAGEPHGHSQEHIPVGK